MRVAKKYVKLKNCILTFEGMPWERMFIKGLKKVNPKINVIGYQHAVVLQSALSAFYGERELNLSPKPDIILTSGIKTQKILNEYGNYPKTHIKVSSSLRYNYLNNIRSHLKLPNIKSMQILVALDGLVETADLLKYSIEQANLNINVNFIVRNHPAISINTMIKIAG